MKAPRFTAAGIKTPRLMRLLGNDPRIAANDEPDELGPRDLAEIDSDFEAERRRQEADAHRNHLKNTGELERRRVEWYARQELDCSFLRGPWPK